MLTVGKTRSPAGAELARQFLPRGLLLLWGLTVLLIAAPAHAWLTVQVASDSSNVELKSGGRAVVTHDLLLEVRGGPLHAVELKGVDTDATWVGTPTITKAQSGEIAGLPINMTPTLSGDSVSFALQFARGVGRGQYLVHFAYNTDLTLGDRVRRRGDLVEVTWQGLRFEEGVNGLRTTFSLPAAEPRPRTAGGQVLVEAKAELVESAAGTLLAELRREAGRDVLMLTKPHAARRERMDWQIWISDTAVDFGKAQLRTSEAPTASESVTEEVSQPIPSRDDWSTAPLHLWRIAALCALVFGGLVGLKFALRRQNGLFELAWGYRALAVGVLIFGSLVLALIGSFPTLAVLVLVAAFPLMIGVSPAKQAPTRGPGAWRGSSLSVPSIQQTATRRNLDWFDLGSWPGALLFCLALLGAGVVALRLIGVAPYYSAMAFVYSAALAPLFLHFGSQTEESFLRTQVKLLSRCATYCTRKGIAFEWLARYPEGETEPDEVRLRLKPKSAVKGFVAAELGVEVTQSLFRQITSPALLIRVLENSVAEQVLPKAAVCRGRNAEERVLVFRPSLPMIAVTGELVEDCLGRLEVRTQRTVPTAADARQRVEKAARATRVSRATSRRGANAPA